MKAILSIIAVALLSACGPTTEPKQPERVAAVIVPPEAVAPEAIEEVVVEESSLPSLEEEFEAAVGTDRVHFRFDQYSLSAHAQDVLRAQATWLRERADVVITVEGHADERGTREYNLALGERRANAVRDFLIAHGVAMQRIGVISYGKERPECVRSTPECWAENRRSVVVLPQE